MKRPTHLGLRHIALHVTHLTECKDFYTNILGLEIVWEPDANNIYMSSGNDNIALHAAPEGFSPSKHQHLDHLGFFLKTPAEVDVWYEFMREQAVEIKAAPKDHRDGTRSFYCADPDGNVIQMIYCDYKSP